MKWNNIGLWLSHHSRIISHGNVFQLRETEIAFSVAFLTSYPEFKIITNKYEVNEVSRFIVTEGREFIQKYLQTKFYKDTSPLTYLKESAMTQDGIWASDVEIIAVSRMLKCFRCDEEK